MSLQRTLSYAALAAAAFVFVDSATAQPRAPEKAPAAASAAHGMHKMSPEERAQHRKEMHDKMHGDKAAAHDDHCMGMTDKHGKMAKGHGKGHDAKGHDHDHGKMAAADGKGRDCGMGKKP